MKKKIPAISQTITIDLFIAAFSLVGKAESNDQNATVASRLKTFDELDFEGFSKENWDLFHKSHSDNVGVVWPDGHETQGFDKHIQDMKYM